MIFKILSHIADIGCTLKRIILWVVGMGGRIGQARKLFQSLPFAQHALPRLIVHLVHQGDPSKGQFDL